MTLEHYLYCALIMMGYALSEINSDEEIKEQSSLCKLITSLLCGLAWPIMLGAEISSKLKGSKP